MFSKQLLLEIGNLDEIMKSQEMPSKDGIQLHKSVLDASQIKSGMMVCMFLYASVCHH
ncbi:hypothetical protein [Desulfobacterium sp. N47]|uniref:Uncharacterized protein n=1 Tax=uncultured Desulfobacterium sp. TaxID=201089 RepID=E1YIH3_9BACT|nr:unknown protein [uncultured Desulfobacterium sp.]